LIQLGERSADLSAGCSKASAYLAQARHLKTGFIQLLAYPALNFLVLSILIGVVRTTLMPQVIDLFQDSGRPLPFSARLIWHMPRLVSYVGAGLVTVLVFAWQSRHRWILAVGRTSAVRGVYVGFCRALALLAAEQIPLATAIELAAQANVPGFLKPYFVRMRTAFHAGQGLAKSIRHLPHLPGIARTLIEAGEATGHPAQGLKAAADFLEQDHLRALARLQFWMTPALLVGLAMGFWLVISGAFLPLYQELGRSYDAV
jgi:general secretion pathway protein F